MQKVYTMEGSAARAKLAVLLLKYHAETMTAKQVCTLALVAHHGGTVQDIRRAKNILRSRRSTPACDLLYKQMADRILVIKFKQQKYETQFRSDPRGSFLEPFPMITSGTIRS